MPPVRIDTDAIINSIRMLEQAGDPAVPAAGYWQMYLKALGLYIEDDAGNVFGPFTKDVRQVLFSVSGVLTIAAGAIRIYNKFGFAFTLTNVFAAVNTAPVGDDIIIDVNKGGVSIMNTLVTIADGTNTGSSADFSDDAWAVDTYLTVDVDQIGVGVAGSNLTVHIVMERA